MVSVVGLVRADDLEDAQGKLKAAVAAKNADQVLAEAGQVFKLAKAEEAKPQPTDADSAAGWKDRIKYDQEVTAYGEYALAATAIQIGDPAKTVELVNALLAENPKSKYVDAPTTNAYLVALGKSGGAAKQMAGMEKVLSGHPENVIALMAVVPSHPAYASRLVAASRGAKPEGMTDAEWGKMKAEAEGTGLLYEGFSDAQRQSWVECDKNLKTALPLISGDQTKLGVAYFSLGVCEYQLGKVTADRSRMQSGQQYMSKSAAIRGPFQNQAYQQNMAMKNELGIR